MVDYKVHILETLLEDALEKNTSDIHIDPCEDGAIIRFRIDGILIEVNKIESFLIASIIVRAKVLSKIRLDIHNKSQDGRFLFVSKDKNRVDIRLSITPTYYGENIVMRLLRRSRNIGNLSNVGFDLDQENIIRKYLHESGGLIIVAGPTGSGKTTTLYNLLGEINNKEKSLVTIEDPVEYAMQGVRHIQLSPEQGFSFPQALRGILRQDPDVLMVGEIRDGETARIALNTALTGHLVLTSIHANNAVGVIPRLIDIGLDPYILSSVLKMVISQRLLRKLDEKGGYTGRIGVFEILEINNDFREAIRGRSSEAELLKISKKLKMKTMQQNAIEKVSLGITDELELKRVFNLFSKNKKGE